MKKNKKQIIANIDGKEFTEEMVVIYYKTTKHIIHKEGIDVDEYDCCKDWIEVE